ncbi:MAG: ATP-binding cassette domain-containing protein [Bacteroidales bacterium]|nr:MAG: ATP-binding cassette domain-containing protein [Bacteroidales bacterium]
MDIFKANNIEKHFGNTIALNEVSINVPEGSIYGLLGPNGAGKTTLLRIINQILAPDKGELFFFNRKLKSDDIFQIGYLPEERGLYKKMKVGEQALYLAQLKGVPKKEALKKLKYWFEKFEIQTWWNKKIEELSKGMQQKIQFIITILHGPALIIFDEPFSGFDPINTSLLKKEVLSLRDKGATIIFSTHDMASVEELCDHITLINKSKTILEGKINDIRNTYKSNTFEIGYKGSPEKVKSLPAGDFELVGHMIEDNTNYARIKVNKSLKKNELLALLIPEIQITSFRELLPNMNEIFIKVVEKYQDITN